MCPVVGAGEQFQRGNLTEREYDIGFKGKVGARTPADARKRLGAPARISLPAIANLSKRQDFCVA